MNIIAMKHSLPLASAIQIEEGRLILRMGLSSIILHEDGKIELKGTQLSQQFSSSFTLYAERVDITTQMV